MNKDKMLVEAIRDGIVLDHIPAEKLFKIVALLRLDTLTTPVTIGNNLMSSRHKRKGIIKMADHFVSSQEMRQVALPSEVKGLVRCPNPKCITNAEPMQTRFHVSTEEDSDQKCLLECHYCGRKTRAEEVELL